MPESSENRAGTETIRIPITLAQASALLPHPVYVRCDSGEILYTNAALRNLNDSLADEALVTALAPPFLPEDRLRFSSGQAVITTDVAFGREGPSRRYFRLTRVPFTASEEAAPLELGLAQEVTAHKLSEISLRRHREALEELVSERTAELRELNRSLELRILDRRQVEEELRQSEQRFRRIVQQVGDYIYTVEVRDGKPVRTTHGPACVAVTGYTSEEFAADPYLWLNMVPKEDRGSVRAQAAAVLRGEEASPIEHRIVRKDRAVRWVRNTSVANILQSGQVTSYDGVVTDITGQKVASLALRDSETRYRRITKSISDYIFTVYVEHGQAMRTVHSAACEAVTGYTLEEFEADPYLWVKMVHPGDLRKVQEHADRVLATPMHEEGACGVGPLEHRIVRKDGALRWVRNTPVPHYDSQGRLTSYDGLLTDITEQRRMEIALEESETKYRELVENASSIILQVDQRGLVRFANQYALDFLHVKTEELVGQPVTEVLVTDANRDKAEAMLANIHRTPEVYRNIEGANLTGDGRRVWVAWTNTALFDATGRPAGVMSVGNDITRRVMLEEELRALSHRDGLTQIPNRRFFDQVADQECQRAYRNQTPIALIMIDIDHFKDYNDHYGHQAGDDALRAVAGALQQALRRPTDMAARYGGEEFVIVLPETTLKGAEQVARHVSRAIHALKIPHEASSVGPYLTVSLGVTATPTPTRSRRRSLPPDAAPMVEPRQLVAQADSALYAAKEAGRDQVATRALKV